MCGGKDMSADELGTRREGRGGCVGVRKWREGEGVWGKDMSADELGTRREGRRGCVGVRKWREGEGVWG